MELQSSNYTDLISFFQVNTEAKIDNIQGISHTRPV